MQAHFDNKEGVFSYSLEELAQEEVDQIDEVLVWLFAWQGFLLVQYSLEQFESRHLDGSV